MPHGVIAARAVADRAVDGGADPLGADQRPGELELRAVAVDAPVVLGRRDHLPRAVAALLDVQDRVADRVLLLLHLRRRLGAAVGLVAVQEERVGVLVVDEQQALAAAVEREVGEEVVVEAVAQRLAAAVAEDVSPRDQHVGAVAGGNLEAVVADAAIAAKSPKWLLPCACGGLGEEVHAGTLGRDGAGGAGARRGDAADEVAPGVRGELAVEGGVRDRHGVRSYDTRASFL